MIRHIQGIEGMGEEWQVEYVRNDVHQVKTFTGPAAEEFARAFAKTVNQH